jgi:hypothetical protein
MLRLLRYLLSTAAASRLVCPVCVSTGVHTGLLVALGLLAAESARRTADVPPLAAQMVAPAEAAEGPDATPVPIFAQAIEAAPQPAAATTSPLGLAAPSLTLLHGPLGGRALPLGVGAASPFDQMGSLGTPNDEGRTTGGGSAAPSAAPARSGSGSSFFGLQSYGNKIVFVVDISGSMHGHRMRRMRNELRHSLEALHSSQQFFVVFFSSVAMPMPAEDLLAATPENVNQAWQWLRGVECGGGTNPLPGLLMALQLQPDTIYLLTDGKFDPQVVWEVAQTQSAKRIPIYTIGFASKKAERLLQAIANETGGSYRFVK